MSRATPPATDSGRDQGAEGEPKAVRKGRFAARLQFPKRTLEAALRVPQAIKDNNGGNPWEPEQIAKVVKLAKSSAGFYYLTAASRDYGLTEGNRDSQSIRLTDLGRDAVYPDSAEAKEQAKLRAFLNVDTFRRVLEHYKGINLPDEEYRSNTLLKTFGIELDTQAEFVDIFQKNCRFLGIGAEWSPADIMSPQQGLRQQTLRTATGPAAVTGRIAGTSPTCFVIMPFSERSDDHAPGFFDEVMEAIFRPAITQAGFIVDSAKQKGSDVIQATIVRKLLAADLVLADLTEHNANVLFELGMRMRGDKPVVLVRAKGTGQIFDVDNMLRVEDYNPCIWPSTVEKDIVKIREHILAGWENRSDAMTYMQILSNGGM